MPCFTEIQIRAPGTQLVPGVTVTLIGPQGPPGLGGGGGGDSGLVHVQSSPAFVWTINNNLGYRPAVTVYNAGNRQVAVMVDHPTVNQTVVTSNISFSGSARLF